MKSTQNRYAARALRTAVRGTLAALAMSQTAYAADEIGGLTQPLKQIEVGIGYVNKDSAKFGEYNGLDKRGVYGLGGFDLSGRGGNDGALLWRLKATDLGLDTRNLLIDLGEPGKYRLTFGYDELQRNYSDTYQTPWRGAGSTSLTLPGGYPAAATRLSSTASANGALSNWNNIQAPYATAACAATGGVPTPACAGPGYLIPGLMQNFDVGTKRTTYDLGAGVALGSNWEFKASARHQLKEGTKLTGVAMNRFSGPSALLPEPINSTTELFEASLRYAGINSHLTIGYSGSFYRNDINLWTAEYAGAAATTPVPGNLARMSGMPDNQMHQFSLAGGYNFSKTTRLVVSGSYSHMTQNEAFMATPPGSGWIVPVSSANAKVDNAAFLARLSARPMKDLSLSVAYKYDDRNNKTPVNNFVVNADITSGAAQFRNEPINRRQQQFNLDGDYRLGQGQAVKAGYEWQEIKRTTNSEENLFRAEKTRENTLRAEYRNNLVDSVTGRVSYARSQRRTSYDDWPPPTTVAPLLTLEPPILGPAPASDPLLPGFRQFFLADRNRDKLRGALQFDATERLSVTTTLDYNRDNYSNSPYGLKEAKSWVLGLDGGFAASETLMFNAYVTYEDMKSKLESLAIARGLSNAVLEAHTGCNNYPVTAGSLPADFFTDPCRNWSETQSDRVFTLGFGAKSKGMLSGKLDLTADLAYSRAVTPITVTGGTYYSNGNATLNNTFIPATSLPDATSNMIDLRLSGTYKVDKSSSIRLNYLYRRLKSADWQWDAYTNPVAMQGYIGTGMTSPNYAVQVVSVSYIYRF